MTSESKLKASIVEYVNRSETPVTFAEMSREVEGFTGDRVFSSETFAPYRVIWHKMSREAIDLVDALEEHGIFLHPAEAADYPPDERPDLPILESFGKITKAHWLPMSFWNEPY